jgi:hypothetical protein
LVLTHLGAIKTSIEKEEEELPKAANSMLKWLDRLDMLLETVLNSKKVEELTCSKLSKRRKKKEIRIRLL